jgi:predicted amidohydrolase YtcJ
MLAFMLLEAQTRRYRLTARNNYSPSAALVPPAVCDRHTSCSDRILAAGPASEIVIPPGTPIIDTRGETMMPGMIEAHAHLVVVGHGDYQRKAIVEVAHRHHVKVHAHVYQEQATGGPDRCASGLGVPGDARIAGTARGCILGKEGDLGTIETGKLADITVIKGNPLFDIVALANVDFVIKDGGMFLFLLGLPVVTGRE